MCIHEKKMQVNSLENNFFILLKIHGGVLKNNLFTHNSIH